MNNNANNNSNSNNNVNGAPKQSALSFNSPLVLMGNTTSVNSGYKGTTAASYRGSNTSDSTTFATANMQSPFEAISISGHVKQNHTGLDLSRVAPSTQSKLNAVELPIMVNMPIIQQKIELTDTDCKTDAYFVPSKVSSCGLQQTPAIFNEFNSILVSNSAVESLTSIQEIFADCDYEYEIEVNFDEENFEITGLVFVNNEPVSFKINIWSELNGSRIEIRRYSGNCLHFHQFYNVTCQRLFKKLEIIISADDSEIDCEFDSDFDCLSMSLDSLPPLENFDENQIQALNDSDLDRFAQDIREDCYQLETLVIIIDNVPKEQVKNHPQLLAAITDCCQSQDFAVKRTAEKIIS
jgi:hypothetical protein